jgi:hypothetical protein
MFASAVNHFVACLGVTLTTGRITFRLYHSLVKIISWVVGLSGGRFLLS